MIDRFGCVCAALLSMAIALTASGAEPPLNPKPVPSLQVLPLPDSQAVFELDGRELARYHFGSANQRPFLFPIVGPSGRWLTRMGHPHDPIGHSHHNSVWISHAEIDGVNFWGDRAGAGKALGKIVHQRMEQYDDGGATAALLACNLWVEAAQPRRVLLEEYRRIEVEPLENGEMLITIDLEFSAPASAATLAQTPFGLIGVRMAKTIGVRDGGGRIRNSAGGIDEKDVFWKPARWCDYSGAVAANTVEGITLLDHPANPNHPTVFHVRDDGWMGASLTFDAPRTIEPGTPLRLRYGLYVHRDLPPIDMLDSRWQQFAAGQLPATLVPAKK